MDLSTVSAASGGGPVPLGKESAWLTQREREVLDLVAQGETYAVIARRLNLSLHTVDTYMRRLRQKTGAANRTQLTVFALGMGHADC